MCEEGELEGKAVRTKQMRNWMKQFRIIMREMIVLGLFISIGNLLRNKIEQFKTADCQEGVEAEEHLQMNTHA